MLKEGKEYIVDIVDIGHKGEAIGKYEGFTVFVDGGLVKDKVKVKITKSKKNYAQGQILEFIEKSPYRVKSPCEESVYCGGCQVLHLDYKKQLEIKTNMVKETLKRIGKLENIKVYDALGMDSPYRYRNKAQFPIGYKNNEVVMGFYKKMTHEIIPSDKCLIQHEINDKIMNIVKEYIKKFNISIYDEKNHKGILRHLVTKVGFKTKEVMVILVANSDKLPHSDKLIDLLKENIEGFKTLVLNINKDKTNVILGKENKVLYGDGKIQDYIGNLKFNISPLSFFQVNPAQTEVLYNKALEYANLTGNENVFDIYCGIGTISLFLAQKAKRVYAVEIVDQAIEDAKINAKLNNIDNVEFFVGKAEDVVPSLYKEGKVADVVVVDPPRKGCDEKVLNTIVNMNPKRIVYVSCNPSTLARDLAYLDMNGYKTLKVQPVDMFPHTMHIESVALIEKN
ncbi:23S rRNA (uracil1939-C5)-methyltransferase [Alkalithermobacter thermoalcaliphilus JW-YL-7 = DSM 7308]|uniref:23S rRNA (Uracil1939-C5)-methyltransferase n=1 Tax=Alkalithermobacter thermoalcaliphilus JW-YL-7 = DSM 7308 TaxID=1121328 RepID=A0A150FS63_CLOPD|nr:RNA methyltransferase, TrmA family [[Clostridium] paradoxum JW-YL-7 = DSM 7308]SHL38331.1 23S rRNA (uracil1939-C5)-methyltransferase [[Clostridium] paradoxum JW-YL-7 = DSM 7308]